MSVEWKGGKLGITNFAGQALAELYRIDENHYGMDEYGMLFRYQPAASDPAGQTLPSLAMVIEGDEAGPIFELTKVAEDPTQPLALLRAGRKEQLKALYASLPIPDPAKEQFINSQGYQFLQQKEIKAAISTFEINVALFPKSSNVYDSFRRGFSPAGE